jgi:hypothetical protein
MPARACLAAVAVLALIGCGALGTGSVPDPTPPTQALAAWRDFPADRTLRPIVLMDIPGPSSGYATGDAKIAAFCNKFKLAFQPSTPARSKQVSRAKYFQRNR